ncbi:hypothetical protein IP78_10425 [Brevundimonas sp. AAP58]|uniref:hypothetical protein n=1 Tax=Brevundimonas sp. AAP58 TaxID=1523422 RepID=UPI0006B9596D|nr:hypothetical protein [Brevundimonas sp. AAP58]KPF78745.1 hypothetical protein IP78_10425 [Brevundimonas sp. AAP58]
MSAPIDRDDLLKKINSKLGWIIFFLVLITLNTCSLDDTVGDALREIRNSDSADADAAAAANAADAGRAAESAAGTAEESN